MKMELPEIRPEERSPLVESLLGIIRQLLDRVAELEETVQQLRDENAILKGQKPRPQIQPSQLESPRKPAQVAGEKRPGSEKRHKNAELVIHRELPVLIDEADLPLGAVLKGYEPFVVQELKIACQNTRYLRARYELACGGTLLAPLPSEVLPGSHYGPGLICYILHQYYGAHVTQPVLWQELRDFGIDISTGQLQRILTENKDSFHREKDELLWGGLTVSSYIGTDDTGARHQGHNGFCTAIGNDLFAYFENRRLRSDSKSRRNVTCGVLRVLHGSQRVYALNETTQAYWERQKLAEALVAKLCAGPQMFAEESAWQARLTELDIRDERHVRIATEGALLGGLVARGVSPELVVLSDGAPQFVVFVHAACWIHAERPLARLVPHNDEHRAAIEKVRGAIWDLYQDLKAYQQQPDVAHQPILESRFDALCGQATGYPSIDGVLKEMREHKADLLRVLERPKVPLHNNGEETDIRDYVKKRKISGGTRSDDGRRCRDTFASIKKTCRKLGVNFWNYLQDRVAGLGQIPRLADLIRQRVAETSPTAATETPPPSAEAVPA